MTEREGGEDGASSSIPWFYQEGENGANVFPGDDAWDGIYCEGGNGSGRSRKCEGCGRPHMVCLCSTIPEPVPISGLVVVLQHPMEIKRRLATIPLLSCCLPDCIVLQGREFGPYKHPQLYRILERAEGSCPVFLMFPGPGAVDLAALTRSPAYQEQMQDWRGRRRREGEGEAECPWAYVLIALDGTWDQAKDIFRNVSSRLLAPQGPALRVELRDWRDTESNEERAACLIRREPLNNCVTTMEAISRALSLLEQDGGAVQQTLLAPLRQLTLLQADFDPAVRARIKGNSGDEGPKLSRRRFGFLRPPSTAQVTSESEWLAGLRHQPKETSSQ